jgi:hypothetical protein
VLTRLSCYRFLLWYLFQLHLTDVRYSVSRSIPTSFHDRKWFKLSIRTNPLFLLLFFAIICTNRWVFCVAIDVCGCHFSWSIIDFVSVIQFKSISAMILVWLTEIKWCSLSLLNLFPKFDVPTTNVGIIKKNSNDAADRYIDRHRIQRV